MESNGTMGKKRTIINFYQNKKAFALDMLVMQVESCSWAKNCCMKTGQWQRNKRASTVKDWCMTVLRPLQDFINQNWHVTLHTFNRHTKAVLLFLYLMAWPWVMIETLNLMYYDNSEKNGKILCILIRLSVEVWPGYAGLVWLIY